MDGWVDVQKQINNFQESAFDAFDFFRATF